MDIPEASVLSRANARRSARNPACSAELCGRSFCRKNGLSGKILIFNIVFVCLGDFKFFDIIDF